jgi:hypothetical protein
MLLFLFLVAVSADLTDLTQKIKLKDIQVLTFRKNEYVLSRKGRFPQLQCTSGCSNQDFVDAVQCKNVGSDGIDVNWECQAQLPPHLKLSNTYVVCESFDQMRPYDPYVILGSCSLDYSLVETAVKPVVKPRPTITQNDSDPSVAMLVLLFSLLVIMLLVFSNCCRSRQYVTGVSGRQYIVSSPQQSPAVVQGFTTAPTTGPQPSAPSFNTFDQTHSYADYSIPPPPPRPPAFVQTTQFVPTPPVVQQYNYPAQYSNPEPSFNSFNTGFAVGALSESLRYRPTPATVFQPVVMQAPAPQPQPQVAKQFVADAEPPVQTSTSFATTKRR